MKVIFICFIEYTSNFLKMKIKNRLIAGFLFVYSVGITFTNFVSFSEPSNLRILRWLNFTFPVPAAYRVSSFPFFTFFPGLIFVPLCLMRIVPGVTVCPSPTFAPRYFGLLSRPSLVEPPAFLCAICVYVT